MMQHAAENGVGLPAAVVDDWLVLIGNSVVHPQLAEHVHHEVEETASGGSLHDGAEQSEGVGGVQERCAWVSKSHGWIQQHFNWQHQRSFIAPVAQRGQLELYLVQR